MHLAFRQFSVDLDETTRSPAETLTACGFFSPPMNQLRHLMLTQPKVARAKLEAFFAGLDIARRHARARELPAGALFSDWIFQDPVCQDLVTADVAPFLATGELALAMINYYQLTLDFDFLVKGGADVLFETARLWLAAGFSACDPRYFTKDNHRNFPTITPEIKTDDLADICYLAGQNLRWAGKIWAMLDIAGKRGPIAERLSLTQAEIDSFVQTASQLSADCSRRVRTQTHLQPDVIQLHQAYMAHPDDQDSAPLAFAYSALVFNCGSLSIEDDELVFKPHCPGNWNGYSFRVAYRGSRFEVRVQDGNCRMTLVEGSAIMVTVYDYEYMLEDELNIPLQIVHLTS